MSDGAVTVRRQRRFDLEHVVLAIAATVATVGLVATALRVHLAGGASLAADVLAATVAGAAAVACLSADRRRTAVGTAWRVVAAGVGLLGVAHLVRAASQSGVASVPSSVIVGRWVHLAGAAAIAAGCVVFHGRSAVGVRARSLLDGVIVGGSALLVGWVTVLRLHPLAGTSTLDHALLLLPILADVVAWTSACLLLAEGGRAPGANALKVLTIATTALLAADLATIDLSGEGHTGLFQAAALRSAALLLLALAGATAEPVVRSNPRLHRGPTTAAMLVPAVAGFGALAVVVLDAGSDEVGLTRIMVGFAIGAMTVARQLFLVRDNNLLHDELEERVHERVREMELTESYFHALVQNSSDVISVVRKTGSFSHVSESVRHVFGLDPAELKGTPLLDIIHPDDHAEVTAGFLLALEDPGHTHLLNFRLVLPDGTSRATETTMANLSHVPSVRGVVCNTRDISDRRALQVQLEKAAFTDPLTGLANRALLLDRMEASIAAATAKGRCCGLVFLDLDGFKEVNDTLGHIAGDDLLREVANRVRSTVRADGLVARLAGDEFAILLEDLDDPGVLGSVCGRINKVLSTPVRVGGRELSIKASIGAALTGVHASTALELLRNADLAMYASKKQGTGKIEHFRMEMLTALQDRVELEADLRRALDHGELILHYQPLIDLETDTIRSLEALVRWQHPRHGLLYPGTFIPLAEQSDLIIKVGRWALHEACTTLARLQAMDMGHIAIAVNISGRQISRSDLVNDVAAALLAARIDAHRLTVEVVETLLVDETPAVVSTLSRLRRLGVKIAIDDFGTGYSSLSKLSRLPIDTIKLDRSFITDLTAGPSARAVVAAVLDLGRILELEVVAEGIETAEQLEDLKSLGLRIGQGFHMMKGVPIEDIEAMLRLRHALRDI